jgi:hypothetical protein
MYVVSGTIDRFAFRHAGVAFWVDLCLFEIDWVIDGDITVILWQAHLRQSFIEQLES